MTHTLTKEEIERYSRQLLLPEIGVEGQDKLKRSKVLIVGAGGLGCPVAMYLAAAGIGFLGIVDYDHVEINNLHRQVAHSEQSLHIAKVNSLEKFCKNLNGNVNCTPYNVQLNSKNAMEIISKYDIVCDCSDNAPTRYLINDACVLARKPLVSGSALRWEGQFTVYNLGDGPCYRCLFPTPPPPETVVSCSEGGVIGVGKCSADARRQVPGIIGNMQALEVVKILTGLGSSFCQKLMIFDALHGQFRCINLRPRKSDCPVCGDHPTITQLVDYEQFCGSGACDKIASVHKLKPEERISVKTLSSKLDNAAQSVLLLDCRPLHEFKICRIQQSHSLPLEKLERMDDISLKIQLESFVGASSRGLKEVYVLCHRGNDSQVAVLLLKQKLADGISVKDVEGGLEEWSKKIDVNFPRY